MTRFLRSTLARLTAGFLLWNAGVAQDVSKVGTTAAKFLSIPVSARAAGMGGAFSAVADDPSAMFWNPSGLARMQQTEALAARSVWIADINYDFVGIVIPFGDEGAAGLSITAMTMPPMEVTTEAYPEGTGETFSAGSYALGVSYARNLTEWFSIGANLKYIQEKIWNSGASALAVDIGTLFTTPFEGIRFGASISNFGGKMQMTGDDLLVQTDIDPSQNGNNQGINAFLATDRFDLPLALRLGLAGEVLKTESQRLTLAVDAAHPNDNTEYANAGFEYSLMNDLLILRAGTRYLFQKDAEGKYAVGGGTRLEINGGTLVKVDYAYEDFGRLKNVHKIALGLQF